MKRVVTSAVKRPSGAFGIQVDKEEATRVLNKLKEVYNMIDNSSIHNGILRSGLQDEVDLLIRELDDAIVSYYPGQ